MSLPIFSAYKYSGCRRLGVVPEHWTVVPCRAIVDHCVVKNEGGKIIEYLSLMANIGVIRYEEKGDIGNKKPDDLSKCKVVKKGDLVINSMNYGIGSYGLSSLDGVCSPVYIVLDPRDDIITERFSLRIFEEKEFQAFAQSFGNGILAHRSAIGWDDLKNIKVALPPLPEQAQIARFLDHETACIDALIEEQQRLIELLKEKRETVISHAVTKGLDPMVPTKVSGVGWLGEVPAHWTVSPLKFLVEEKVAGPYGASLTKAMYTSSGYRVYGQQQVILDDFSIGDYYISEEKFSEMQRYVIFPGDVLVSVMGTIGRVSVVPLEIQTGIINPRLVRYKFMQSRVAPEFVKILLMSLRYQSRLREESQGSTMEGLNMVILGDLPLVLPPLDTQRSIVAFVKNYDSSFNELVSQAASAVDFLQERRSALISAAVTGKVDVSGWRPPISEPYPELEEETV
ncbi:restriction endonuclease subunit S [Pseudomonas chlororaphis]